MDDVTFFLNCFSLMQFVSVAHEALNKRSTVYVDAFKNATAVISYTFIHP